MAGIGGSVGSAFQEVVCHRYHRCPSHHMDLHVSTPGILVCPPRVARMKAHRLDQAGSYSWYPHDEGGNRFSQMLLDLESPASENSGLSGL